MLRCCLLASAAFASSALAEPLTASIADGTGLADSADPIVIVGQRVGYDAEASDIATRTDTRLVDIPQAISVITDRSA